MIIAGFADSLVLFRSELLKAILDRNWEVHAAAPGLTAKSATCEELERMGVVVHDIAIKRTGTNPVSDIWLLVRLFWLFLRLKPDAVLGYTIKPIIYGTIAAWLARIPKRFALVTGLGYMFVGQSRGKLHALIKRMYAFALGHAQKTFFQNTDDLELFGSFGIITRDMPSVVVNGSGVNLKHFTPASLSGGPMRFLMICRLLGAKGVRDYVEAARMVKRHAVNARFGLAGWIDDGPDAIAQEELDAWVDDGIIEYFGKLDDVRPAIADCTVYVLPSYREGTPRTVLEAMAMGRAIITTDVPGCRETVIEGVNGFLVPVKSPAKLAEAMTQFAVEPELATKMGSESRKLAELKYDVHKVNAIMLQEMEIS